MKYYTYFDYPLIKLIMPTQKLFDFKAIIMNLY